jgi:hypothetical protein
MKIMVTLERGHLLGQDFAGNGKFGAGSFTRSRLCRKMKIWSRKTWGHLLGQDFAGK